jgi:MoaA/NifB/PqqE/SkfB family radical SAM enzyme
MQLQTKINSLKLLLKNRRVALRLVQNFLKNKTRLDYRYFSEGRAFLPQTVVFYPTMRCNLDCDMCLYPDKSSESQRKELPLEIIFKFITEISKFKPHFCISGGEPLLHPNIIEIIKHVKKNGMICTMTTNGTLCDEKTILKIIHSGLDSITFSIDGGEEIHDTYRGKGNFQKTITCLKNLIRERERSSFPQTRITSVINNINYLRLEEILELARQYQVNTVTFNHMDYKTSTWIGRAKNQFTDIFNCPPRMTGFVTDSCKFELDAFVESLSKIQNSYNDISIKFSPNIPLKYLKSYYVPKQFPWNDVMCVRKWDTATIWPNGDIIPCLGMVMGNLQGNTFSEIWNNEMYKNFRKQLKKYKTFHSCVRCCSLNFNEN